MESSSIGKPDSPSHLAIAAEELGEPVTQQEVGAAPARRTRAALLIRMLVTTDFFAAVVACGLAPLLLGASPVETLVTAAVGGLLWPTLAFAAGLYVGDDLRTWASGIADTPRFLVSVVLFSWPVFAVLLVLAVPTPGFAMLILIPIIVLLSSTLRAGVRAGLHRVEPLTQRAVVVGSGMVAGMIVEKLEAHRQFGLIAVGSVDDETPEVSNLRLPRLGTLADLPTVLRFHEIDRVIIAFSRSGHEDLLGCIRVCRDQGVVVDVVPRLFEFLDGARSLDYVGGLPVLTIGTPRLNRASQVAKRGLDAVVAVVALILLAPLLALVAAAIKLESPGPVVFRQPRVGRGGKSFGILKFRSMYADAELRKPDLEESNGDDVLFKLREDPRITRVGRVLRRFSIDELPQLVNVLRGHMSLVGPRPLINPEIEAMDQEWQERRLDLRPGITGPWQVTGRSESPFEEMVRLDYQYVAGWSLARDVEILLATIPAVLSGRGAY